MDSSRVILSHKQVWPAVRALRLVIPGVPFQYSRSEVVLTFFERSPLDQVLKNDNVRKIQPSFQSPVKISGERPQGRSWLGRDQQRGESGAEGTELSTGETGG